MSKDLRPHLLKLVKSKRNGQWRYKLYGANGELVCSGEQHPSKFNAERAFNHLKLVLGTGNYTQSP